MANGKKAQGFGSDVNAKEWVRRHGGGSLRRRRAAARAEKAIETKVRQRGKKACRDGLRDYREG